MTQSITIDNSGNSYYIGEFLEAAQFQDIALPEGSSWTNFFARLAPAGTAEVSRPVVATEFCSGADGSVSFTTKGTFGADNYFSVQLIDAEGCTTPVTIGSGKASPVPITIPAGTAPDTNYRIRIVASSPHIIGKDNGVPVIIKPLYNLTLPVFGDVCSSVTNFPLPGGMAFIGTYSGPGVANGVFNATVAGTGTHTITYSYTNYYGCTETAVRQITVQTCTSSSKTTPENTLLVYPNPTSGKISITAQVGGVTDVTVKLISMQGVVIQHKRHEGQAGEFKTSLDLGTESKGIYLLHLVKDNEVLIKRIVLQ